MELALHVRTWAQAQVSLRPVREKVYIQEQAVPIPLEWDGLDQHCLHVVAEVDGEVVGVGRVHAEENRARLGRMAVLKSWRGKGVGGAILETLLTTAAELGLEEAFLLSQSRAVGFYEKHGFKAMGEEFEEAGILHREMRLRL